MTPRLLLVLLIIPLLGAATGCQLFKDGSTAVPIPDPPDPDPPLPDPPVRGLLVTPGNPAPAGSVVTFTTDGDPLLATDLITWSVDPSAATLATLPTGAGGVLFPELSRFEGDQIIDVDTPLPARWRFAAPGDYTITTRETGVGYTAIDRTFTLTVNAGAPGTFRPESTEVTGFPAYQQSNVLIGVQMGNHATGLSTGSDSLGEVLVVFVKQQREDTVSGDVYDEFVLYLGDVSSGLWTVPIAVSTDPRDRAPRTNTFPLREYGPINSMSTGIAVTGRSLDLAWVDLTGKWAYCTGTLSDTGGALDVGFGTRVEFSPSSSYRAVPLRSPSDQTVISCTNGTPIQAQSHVAFVIDRAAGTFNTLQADIINNSDDTARLNSHDATFDDDGSLLVATLESSASADTTPDLYLWTVAPNFLAAIRLATLDNDVRVSEPPAILRTSGGDTFVALAREDDARLYRRLPPGGIEAFFIPERGSQTVRTIALAESTTTANQLLVLVQYGTGSTLENVQGELRLHTADLITGLSSLSVDGIGLPPSFLLTSDNGPGAVIATSAGTHVIWQENGIDRNRNARILEARES